MSKHKSYFKLTGAQQAQIAKFVFAHGNKEALHQFTNLWKYVLHARNLWKFSHHVEIQPLYTEEINRKQTAGEFEPNGVIAVHSIPSKKRCY